MRAEIASTSPQLFQRIVLSYEEFVRAKEGDDELEWNDSMYDIATAKINGQQVEVLALRDEFETDLLALASEIINCASADSKAPPASLTQYIDLNFTVPTEIERPLKSNFSTILHNTQYTLVNYEQFSEIPAPPPRA